MSNVIEVRDISIKMGGVHLFANTSIDIEAGKTYALTGPNGSGKSVLLRMLCGFITPDSGQVWVDPRYLSPRRTFPDQFGITIDGPAYLPGRTGLDNLIELARIRGCIGTRQIRATMLRVGLDPDTKQKARHYSLGMKQKLSLAQALMEEPQVLILDEPFNALDAASVSRVKSVLRHEQSAGKTLVFTSHLAGDVRELSDHVFRINNLKLEEADAVETRKLP